MSLILSEFNKRYKTGMTPEEIDNCYATVAEGLAMGKESVEDYVLLYRYNEEEEEDNLERLEDED